MQIMPTISVNNNDALGAALAQNYQQQYTQTFADNLDEAYDELLNETEESDADRERAQKAAGIYSHTTNGYTYTLEEVSFTQKEITELCSQLEAAGAPKSNLTGLKKLAELPGGANLGQVVNSLHTNKNDQTLGEGDEDEITSLLGNIDPSGVLGGKVLNSIYNGNPHQALSQILDGLGELEPTEAIQFSKSELLALGRGLGLNDNNMQKLEDLFGSQENAKTIPAGLAKALSPAQDQLLTEKTNKEKLNAALNKTLTPMLNKAHERMNKEAESAALKNRKADQSQVMIDKTVQNNSRNLLNKIIDSGNDRLQQQDQSQLNEIGKAQIDMLKMSQGEDPKSLQDNFLNSDSQNQQKHTSWDDLLNKVTLQNLDQKKPSQNQQMPLMQNNDQLQQPLFMGQGESFNLSGAQQNFRPNSANVPLQSHVTDQVQNGLLTTFKNGTTQLELQLHPQELGTIAVTLTSRNGEVSAKILADNEQTVEMLNKQAELIKTNLQEQGVQIDKIEVELRDQSENDYNAWQNLDQHNSFQEESARRDQLRRLRNLANLENRAAAAEDSTLERHMHREGQSTTNATRVLDKVA